MIILGNTTQSLQIALAAPAQANPLHFTTSYVDGNSSLYDPDPYTGTVADSTPVDLAPHPVAGRKRKVASASVYNDDTDAATVIVTFKDGANARKLCTVTLQPGETLQYGDLGWSAIDANGALKQTLAAPTPDNSLSLEKLQQIAGQSLLGNSALVPGNVQALTMGYMLQLSGQKLIFTQSFEDYCASVGFDITSGADAATTLQNFRIKGYLLALSLGARSLSDQGQTVRIRQTCNATKPIRITSPDIIPPFVDCDFTTQILRDGSSGTITANYNGDPTSKALANQCQPAVIVAACGHASNVIINSNPGSGPQGSGFYAVRGWRITGGTIASGGAGGKSVGDKFTTANAQLAPYVGATCTITAVDGSGRPTAFTVDGGVRGLYPFPSQLLVNTWTAANGFNGTKYPQVFDGGGHMLTNISGVTITPVWEQDWADGRTQYAGDTQAPQVDCLIGNVRAENCGTANDAAYGPVRCTHQQGLFISFQTIYSNGGYIGNSVNATDVIGGTLYNVGALTQFRKFAGGNMACRVFCDTPGAAGHYFDIDRADGLMLDMRCFNNGSSDLTGAAYGGRIGANTGDSITTTGKLRIQMENAGTPDGIPALFADHANNIDIDLQIINSKNGSALPFPISKAVVFGNNNGSGNRISIVTEDLPGAIFSGPSAGWSVQVARRDRDVTAAGTIAVKALDRVVRVKQDTPAAATVSIDPTVLIPGEVYTVIDWNGTSQDYPLAVTPTSGKIAGQSSVPLNGPNNSLSFTTDGTNFGVI